MEIGTGKTGLVPTLSILANLPQGVLGYDAQGLVVFSNPASEDLFGVPQKKLIGKNSTGFFIHPVNGDGSPLPPSELPCRLALQEGKMTKNRLIGFWNPHRNMLQWVIVNSIPVGPDANLDGVRVICFYNDVTELENTRKALAETNLTLAAERRLFVAGPVVVFKWRNAEGWPVEYVSPNVEKVFGYSPDDLLSGRIAYADLIDPEELPRVLSEVTMACERHADFFVHEPYPIIRKDGERIWVDDHTSILRDESGGVTQLLGYIIDITRRKKAEEALQESEEKARSLIEKSPMGIHRFIVNSEGKLLFLGGNAQADAILKIRHDTLTGREILEAFPGLVGTRIPEIYRNICLNGGSWSDEQVNYQDSKISGSFFVTAFQTGPGRAAVLFLDTTAMKRADLLLRKQKQAMDQALAGIVLLTLDHRIEYANHAFATMHGYLPEELLGLPFSTFHTPEQLAGECKTFLEGLHANGWNDGLVARMRRDGTVFNGRITARILLDATGNKTGITATIHDVTEEERLRERLRQSQKMEAIGHLAGGIAHDFNNLLMPIIGYSELLKRGLEGDPKKLDQIHQIQRAAERSKGLILQLLAFSRKQVLQKEPLVLNRIITDFEKMLRRVIRENIHFELQLDDDLGPISGDAGMMEQILVNLVVNAQDAIAGEGLVAIETRNLTISSEYTLTHPDLPPGDYVQLTVSDNGRGMDRATQARIFEPFFTTKNGGTGLGLATVYGIVRQHGGSINVYSEPDKGSTFRLYFPRLPAVEPAATSPTASLELPTGTEQILLVEDNDLVRTLAKTILEGLAYRVFDFATPSAALREIPPAGVTPVLLLTDMVLPEMNGKELYLKMKHLFPRLRVLYMSGYTDDIIAHQGILEANTNFLQKPFSVQELAAKIREVLNQEE